jgi:hypothetical protein
MWKILVVAFILLSFFLSVWWPGKRGAELEGILEVQEERAAFYPNGSCWRDPYWFQMSSGLSKSDYDLLRAARPANGHLYPAVYRIKFVGNLSKVGSWGRLGKYFREVHAYSLKELSPIPRGCTT